MTLLEQFRAKVKEIDTPILEEVKAPLKEIPKTVTQERWTVYSFSVPIKYSKKLAFGFESRQAAQQFIKDWCKAKSVIVDEVTYHIRYDVILESREQVDVLYNDPEITIVGNDKDVVLESWIG